MSTTAIAVEKTATDPRRTLSPGRRSLRLGLIGANRTRQGTGPFVARFLTMAGADVRAVVASSQERAEDAATSVEPALGHRPAAFGTVGAMLAEEALDAVAICSPAELHWQHLEAAFDARLHVLCEKPLAPTPTPAARDSLVALVQRFEDAGLVLHCSTQWPYTLATFRRLHGRGPLLAPKQFRMTLAPPRPGLETLFWDTLPHPVSLLTALGARAPESGHPPSDLTTDGSRHDRLHLRCTLPRGDGGRIAVTLDAKVQTTQPRPASYAIDGAHVDRRVRLDPYRLELCHGDRCEPLPDPLRASVEDFLDKVSDSTRRPSNDSTAIHDVVLLEALYRGIFARRQL